MLRNANIKRLLCINATAQMGTLDEVAKAYGEGLTGAVITKMDEAATLGNVLDVVIRRQIPVSFESGPAGVPLSAIAS